MKAPEEATEPLPIGSIVGRSTPTNKRWRDAIQVLSLAIIEARDGIASDLNLNVVVQVPGTILAPDFHGIRTGRYARTESRLMVQVALPPEAPADADAYLREATSRRFRRLSGGPSGSGCPAI